jgi:hypothetical protein
VFVFVKEGIRLSAQQEKKPCFRCSSSFSFYVL